MMHRPIHSLATIRDVRPPKLLSGEIAVSRAEGIEGRAV